MEVTEKQCSTCGVIKPLSAFTYRTERNTYKAQCKDCCRATIDAHRYGKASELYKEKERNRSAERKEYLTDWQCANRVLLNERARTKSQEARAQQPPSSAVYFRACQHTGRLFAARSKATKYSPEGRRLFASAKAEAKHNAPACVCQQCACIFTPAYGQKSRTYCSTTCKRRALRSRDPQRCNHRKRARKYGVPYEYINVTKVLEAGGYVCAICGCATPVAKRGSFDDDAPELDHIIALSQGGGHILDNVQCACRKCNNSKGSG